MAKVAKFFAQGMRKFDFFTYLRMRKNPQTFKYRNMRRLIKIFSLTAALLGAAGLVSALQSCRRDARIDSPADGVEVRFTGDVAQRESTRTNADGTQWVAGDRVGVYMVGGTSNSTSFSDIRTANKAYTAQGGGARRSFRTTQNHSITPLKATTFASLPTTPTKRA